MKENHKCKDKLSLIQESFCKRATCPYDSSTVLVSLKLI